MPAKSTTCPKCGGGMKQGFIMDFAHSQFLVSQWAPGAPKRSFWMGTKKPKEGLISVGTYRCDSCGFLESYARPEFDAK